MRLPAVTRRTLLQGTLLSQPQQQVTLDLQQGRSGALSLPISVGSAQFNCAIDTHSRRARRCDRRRVALLGRARNRSSVCASCIIGDGPAVAELGVRFV